MHGAEWEHGLDRRVRGLAREMMHRQQVSGRRGVQGKAGCGEEGSGGGGALQQFPGGPVARVARGLIGGRQELASLVEHRKTRGFILN